jgi:IS605 OrfB family transposase
MSQTISVSCKLQVPVELRQEIDRTLQAFADGCNQILQVSKDQKIRNTTKLHHATYYDVRAKTGLKANHVCQAIRRVIGAVTGQKQVHEFRPTSMSLDVRTFTYNEAKQFVSITLLNGRVKLPLSIGNYQLGLLKGQSPTSAVLCKRRNGDYYLQIQVDVPTQPPNKTPKKVIGVDVGRKDIAHTSTGMSWSGERVQKVRDHFQKVRSSVQSKCTRGAKRLLKRLSGRERRFQANINHTISRQMVDEAQRTGASLAFEDLTGIRQRAKVRKADRRQHHSWSFYQLRQFTAYKAIIAGVQLILVDPRYTSQTCHNCLHIHPEQGKSYRNGKSYSCGHCGWHGDADFNAANVISLLGGSLSVPESNWVSCILQGASEC